MGETLEKIRNQLNSFWEEMDKKKRIMLVSAVALGLIVVSSAIFFLTRTEYAVLYSNLTLTETGAITAKLDEQGIPWKEGAGGTQVSVPSAMQDRAKISLAMEGLPEQGYTYDQAFDEMDWTTTEYDKRQKLKYALENSLAGDIASMDGIDNSEVRLTIPEETGYVIRDNNKPTASVFLTINRNQGIRQESISGIQHLVANAVSGMDPMDVSVVGNDGQLLSQQAGDPDQVDMTDQIVAQQSMQDRLDQSIKSFLENAYGRGKVDVRTNVRINFDSELENITEYESPIEGGEEGIARSVEESEERSTSTIEGAVPGVDPNAEDEPVDFVEVEGQEEEYEKIDRITNYELNERTRQIRKEPGQIEDVTVAILIDENAIGEGLTDDAREDIENLIFAATGIMTQQVQVSAMAFGAGDEMELEEVAEGLPAWVFFLIGLSVLLVGAIVFLVIRNRRQKELDELEKQRELEELVDETADYMEDDDVEFGTEKSKQKEQISKFIDQKPEIIAQLLRSWLNEE